MPRRSHLLLLTLGAAAGVVAGALLIDRMGGPDRLLSRLRRRGGGDQSAHALSDEKQDSDDLFRSAEGEMDDLDAFSDEDRARWRIDDDDEFLTARPSSAA